MGGPNRCAEMSSARSASALVTPVKRGLYSLPPGPPRDPPLAAMSIVVPSLRLYKHSN